MQIAPYCDSFAKNASSIVDFVCCSRASVLPVGGIKTCIIRLHCLSVVHTTSIHCFNCGFSIYLSYLLNDYNTSQIPCYWKAALPTYPSSCLKKEGVKWNWHLGSPHWHGLTDWINLYWAPARRNGGILVDYYYFYIWALSATDYVNSPEVMTLDHCPAPR